MNSYPPLELVKETPSIWPQYEYFRIDKDLSPVLAAEKLSECYDFSKYVNNAEGNIMIFRLRALLLGEWRRSKDVVTFPKYFWELSDGLEDLELSTKAFEWLHGPKFNEVFYIDFEGYLPKVHGAFFTAMKTSDDTITVTFLIALKDGVLVGDSNSILSFYSIGEKTMFSDIKLQYNENLIPDTEMILRASKLAFSAILFMGNLDISIKNHPERNKTYKKGSSTQDIYSEVKKTIYGNEIKKCRGKNASYSFVPGHLEEDENEGLIYVSPSIVPKS